MTIYSVFSNGQTSSTPYSEVSFVDGANVMTRDFRRATDGLGIVFGCRVNGGPFRPSVTMRFDEQKESK